MTNTPLFSDFKFSPDLLSAVTAKGYTEPTAIQGGVIPLFLAGERDIIGQAQTGTGKTAAFALPLLEKINAESPHTQAIILAPTRELAIQVAVEIHSFSLKNAPTTALLYGGQNMREEERALRKNPHIVVGTPGRVRHHIRNQNLKLQKISHFILDEADEMLNFGFREEIEDILTSTPKNKRVLLFSATMPKSILDIVHQYMGEYDLVSVKNKNLTNASIHQKYYCLRPHDRFDALCRIIEMEDNFYAIVFCRTKNEVDLVSSQLSSKLYHVEGIHGDIDQSQREKTLSRFRSGKINILVATDVAARGIDVSNLNFVINYSLPENHEIYTHRIGRTGRAGNTGTAITLVGPREVHRIRYIEQRCRTTIEKALLPQAKDIVEKKKKHLLQNIARIIDTEKLSSLNTLSEKLLQQGSPTEVVSALIREAFHQDFDVASYRAIDNVAEQKGAPRGQSRGGYHNRGRGGARQGGGGYSRGKPGGRHGGSSRSGGQRKSYR